jgi:hypothetical protein
MSRKGTYERYIKGRLQPGDQGILLLSNEMCFAVAAKVLNGKLQYERGLACMNHASEFDNHHN